MRSFKCVSVVAAVLLAYATIFSQSLDFSVSGKVIVAGGNPVADATITYTNLAKRLSWDFSKSDGTFGGYAVQAVRLVQQNATITLLGAGPVSIDIIDMGGKKVETISGKLDKGTYFLQPLPAKLAQSMYVLKIRAGDKVMYQKMLNTGIRAAGYTIPLSSSKEPVVMAKKLAVIDSIRVGKTGYTPAYVPIQTYADNVGNVTIAPVDIETQVTAKFGQLTAIQKAGQLNMPITSTNPPPTGSALAGANVGSVFGGGGALQNSSASGAADMIDGYQNAMMGSTLKIPVLAAYDFVHGASAVPGCTFFPHNLGMGAIQDTVLIQKAYRVTAFEVRGAGCNMGFGPCIAVIRDDRWGRAYEGFAETPERTVVMAHHSVRGIQLTDLSNPLTYAACAKHFAGDGGTANGTDRGQTTGTDATAAPIHLPGYVSAVAAGVATIMPSFSTWSDGTAMHMNSKLMLGWLKQGTAVGGVPGLQFGGYLVGDYDAHSMPGSIDAGLDVPMASYGGTGYTNTINSNYTGTHVARFDDAVKRVLRVKAWMGMLDPAGKYLADRRLTALVGCAAHRDVARACVRASLVLLKNANATLPMPKTANIAIWGNGGDDVGIQCGGWTVSWQGGAGTVQGATSIRAGMQALVTAPGAISYVASPNAVGTSDYIVAVLSENPYAETDFSGLSLTNDVSSTKGNLTTTSNSAVITQIAAAHTAGKKVVGILIAGRPMDITAVLPNCDAFVWACLPGSEGKGVAEMLYADQGYKFTGKLPVTWPNSVGDEPINQGDTKTGLFAYGAGLTD
jgi:beta-glucosidase